MKIQGALLALLALSSQLLAANWPEWRGPSQNGETPETDLPLQWSATQNVKWKTPLPDIGNSTPIVWGNRIFVTQALEDQGKRLLICFDRKDGQLLWQKGPVFPDKEPSHRTNPQASPSPVTDGQRVIAWFGSAGLFCYDMNGKELWKRDLGRQTHEWGYAASPVIYKDLCFLNFGPGQRSFFAAFDKRTGKTVWEHEIPEVQPDFREDGFKGQKNGVIGSWSTPIIVKTENRDELVISLPDWVKAFNPETGEELWRCAGPNPLIYTSPVYGEGVIVVMGGFHGPALAVKPGGNGDVTDTHKLWQTGSTPNRLGSPVIKDGHIYVMNMPGIAECFDLKTGQPIWEERLRGTGPKNDSWSSMVLSGDRIYILNQSADTIIVKANPKFEVLAVNSLDNELTNSSIVVSDGEIFIRTHEHLWCISDDVKTASR